MEQLRIIRRMLIVILTISCISVRVVSANSDKIIFAAVIYQHGGVNPLNIVNDRYDYSSAFPLKHGQLSNEGKHLHYELGKWLRKRYSDLLSEKYKCAEVRVLSSDLDRTLMSAEANLAGMFPPVGDEVWNSDLLWQPIPVHTVPLEMDNMLAKEENCPAYTHMLENITEIFKTSYLRWYSDLSNATGELVEQIDDFRYLNDVLKATQERKITLPEWADTNVLRDLEHWTKVSLHTPITRTNMRILRVAPLLQEITSYIQLATNANEPDPYSEDLHPKVAIYSAHDHTITDLVHTLTTSHGIEQPPVTATLFIEVLEEKVGARKYKVRLSYRNFTQFEEPHILQIHNCELEQCDLVTFLRVYSYITEIDWKKECNNLPQEALQAETIALESMER